MHTHYLALVEFHVCEPDNKFDKLREKLFSLADMTDTELGNTIRIFEKI